MHFDLEKCVNDVMSNLQELNTKGNYSCCRNGSDVLKEIISIYDNNMKGISHLSTMTGYKQLDEQGGLFASDLIVIGADTSVGKSSFATSLIVQALRESKKVAIINYEMSDTQTIARMIAPYADLSSNDILRKQGNAEDLQKLEKGIIDFDELAFNIIFPDKEKEKIDTIEQVVSFIRKCKLNNNISGVVIDYLGLIKGQEKTETLTQFTGRCIRSLKNLAVELNIWIIALVQFNRDNDNNKLPSLARLKDSTEIEQASDVVMLIYRPEHTNPSGSYTGEFKNISTKGTAQILIEKFRNGSKSSFIVGFDGRHTRYYPLSEPPKIGAYTRTNKNNRNNVLMDDVPMPFSK